MIREILASKGLQVSNEDYEELEKQWEGLQALRRGFETTYDGEADIAVKYIPGGDHV